MSYSYMDNEELTIATIDDIVAISSFNIFNSNENTTLIGFEAKCAKEDGSFYNVRYFTDDKHYLSFIKKVYEFYASHKDEFSLLSEVTLSIGKDDRKRKIDDFAKKMFEQIDAAFGRDKLNLIFEQSTKRDFSSFGDFSREIESNLSTLKHELLKIFSYSGEEVVIDENVNVYNDTFVLKVTRNGVSSIIPVHYEKIDDGEYRFSIGNVFKDGFVVLNIRHDRTKSCVSWSCSNKPLSSYTTITCDDGVSVIDELYRNGDLISYNRGSITPFDTQETDPDVIAYFNYIGEDINNYKLYHLPNGEIYAISNDKEGKEIEVTKQRIIRMSKTGNKLHARDSYIESLFGNKTLVHANGFVIDTTLIKGTDDYLIETVFLDTPFSNGEYKKQLNGKVVYKILRGNQTHEISSISELDIQRLYLRGEK